MEFHYPMLDQRDLDGDGRPEILIAAFIGMANTVSLAALSSQDGRLLWKIPMHGGAYIGNSPIDRNVWHDLNGDGCLDLVLWVPQSIGEHGVGNGFEARAFSGRDGSTLWNETAYRGLGWFTWPRPCVADLDGDGKAEVILTSTDIQGQPPRELAAVDGRTGTRIWDWKWLAAEHTIWPPLPIDIHGDGRRAICMAIHEQGQPHNIVIFDAKGAIQQRIPLGWIPQASTWTALDVNGDGAEELLYLNENRLHAYSIRDQRALWQSNDFSWWRLGEFRPGDTGEPGTLVGGTGRTFSGINAATGAVRWRCEVPTFEPYQPLANLAFPTNSDRPFVVSYDPRVQSTLLQRAASTSGSGLFQAPEPAPIKFAEYKPPVHYQPLPWVRRLLHTGPSGYREPTVKIFLRVSEWPMILVVVGLFGYWMAMGRRRCAAMYLAFCLFVTVVVVVLMLASAHFPPDNDKLVYAWDGWYWALYPGVLVTGGLTVILGAGLGAWHLLHRTYVGFVPRLRTASAPTSGEP